MGIGHVAPTPHPFEVSFDIQEFFTQNWLHQAAGIEPNRPFHSNRRVQNTLENDTGFGDMNNDRDHVNATFSDFWRMKSLQVEHFCNVL